MEKLSCTLDCILSSPLNQKLALPTHPLAPNTVPTKPMSQPVLNSLSITLGAIRAQSACYPASSSNAIFPVPRTSPLEVCLNAGSRNLSSRCLSVTPSASPAQFRLAQESRLVSSRSLRVRLRFGAKAARERSASSRNPISSILPIQSIDRSPPTSPLSGRRWALATVPAPTIPGRCVRSCGPQCRRHCRGRTRNDVLDSSSSPCLGGDLP
ncbi:hypothetical protein C8Q80DRAFT_750090 [Daedaleopsis nitida]|nr:hypothetical protein C8Q80DRAFT_750090 [Daedaleopsis nitida]